jgi:phosphoserine phosphatase RsbU/P
MTCRWQVVERLAHDHQLDEGGLAAIGSVPMDHAQRLLGALEKLVLRLEQAESVIRRQEAEIATTLLVTSQPDRQQETADRLESILESTSRALGAVAAAAYLLDDTTSNLKMRSCFGLPRSRLAQEARELRGSLADLEALMGNAVLLNDIEAMHDWHSPEPYGAALIVPVGTSTMPHGTIWFWCESKRTFSAAEVEVANLAAGRIMAEIEQSSLGQEVTRSRSLQKQMHAAGTIQESMLPDTQILHEDFDVSGWTNQHGCVGGAFHHWHIVPNGVMTFAVGNAIQSGAEGSLVATSALSLIRTLWNQGASPKQILRTINDTHWSMSPADWNLALALVQLNPVTGYGSMCISGDIQAFIVSSRGARPIGMEFPPIGSQPDTSYTPSRFVLQPGEILVAYSSRLFGHSRSTLEPCTGLGDLGSIGQRRIPSPKTQHGARETHLKGLNSTQLLNLARDLGDESAQDIAGSIARLLPANDLESSNPLDRSMLLIKNIRKAYS